MGNVASACVARSDRDGDDNCCTHRSTEEQTPRGMRPHNYVPPRRPSSKESNGPMGRPPSSTKLLLGRGVFSRHRMARHGGGYDPTKMPTTYPGTPTEEKVTPLSSEAKEEPAVANAHGGASGPCEKDCHLISPNSVSTSAGTSARTSPDKPDTAPNSRAETAEASAVVAAQKQTAPAVRADAFVPLSVDPPASPAFRPPSRQLDLRHGSALNEDACSLGSPSGRSPADSTELIDARLEEREVSEVFVPEQQPPWNPLVAPTSSQDQQFTSVLLSEGYSPRIDDSTDDDYGHDVQVPDQDYSDVMMVNLSANPSPRVDEDDQPASHPPAIPMTGVGALSMREGTGQAEPGSDEPLPPEPESPGRKLRHVSISKSDELRQKLELLSQLKQASPELRKALLRQLSRLHSDEPEVAAALRETPLTPRRQRMEAPL